MGVIESSNKLKKDVSKMNHLIMDGNNIMVLKLSSCKSVKDIRKQDGWIFETRKHYCEELERRCLNQPIESKVIIKKQVLLRLRDIIIRHFKGVEPEWLPVVIQRNKVGSHFFYKVIFAFDEASLDDFIDCIKLKNYKKINELFIIDKELKGWRY